jgi:hypothetical protein
MEKIKFSFEFQDSWTTAFRNFCFDLGTVFPNYNRDISIPTPEWIESFKNKLYYEHPEAKFKRDIDPFFTFQITDPHPTYCIEFPDDGSYIIFLLRWG